MHRYRHEFCNFRHIGRIREFSNRNNTHGKLINLFDILRTVSNSYQSSSRFIPEPCANSSSPPGTYPTSQQQLLRAGDSWRCQQSHVCPRAPWTDHESLAAGHGHLAGGEHPALVPGVDEALQVGVVLVPAQACGPVGLEPAAAGRRRGPLPRERARARAQLHHVARRQRREVGRRPAGEEARQHGDEEDDGQPHP